MVKQRQFREQMQNGIRASLALVGAVLCLFCTQPAQAVTLAWDPSPDPDVTGYAIYYGTNSGNYTTRVDVGCQTNATVEIPANGATYYFAATAYTSDGVESLPSNEVSFRPSYVAPEVEFHVSYTLYPAQAALRFLSLAEEEVSVEVSEDLQSWSSLYQLRPASSAIMQLVDPASAQRPQRFYRLAGNNLGPRSLELAQLPAGMMNKVSVRATSSRLVEIQFSEDSTNWNTLCRVVCPDNQTIEFVDAASAGSPQRFYRVLAVD